MRLQVESGLPIAGGIIGAGGKLIWPRPTRPGDVLHVETEVLEVKPSRSRPDRGMVTVRSELPERGVIHDQRIGHSQLPRSWYLSMRPTVVAKKNSIS
jgi:acyl dehydratase